MRVNVYSQEIDTSTPPVIVTQDGFNSSGQAQVFYGIRFYLHSSERLHYSPMDDDRSAVTFWLPTSSTRRIDMSALFAEAVNLITKQVVLDDNAESAAQHGPIL